MIAVSPDVEVAPMTPCSNRSIQRTAGMSLVIAGHPMDTVKVRLQTSSQYKNAMDCVTKTIKNDGVRLNPGWESLPEYYFSALP
jgi:hypothetical protein